MSKQIAYHGTSHFIDQFNLEWLKDGEHENGIGIYFTKKIEHTEHYAYRGDKKGNIYAVELDLSKGKVLNYKDTLEYNDIYKIIKNAPDLEYTLLNFTDDPNDIKNNKDLLLKGISKDYKDISIRDLFTMIYMDFFKKMNIKEFVEIVQKETNIDAIKITSEYDTVDLEDYCVLNPEIIEIKGNLNKEAEKEYQSKKSIAYHGTDHFIDEFNLDWLDGGEHMYGIGIYFTANQEVTDFYANSSGQGNVYKVEIDYNSGQFPRVEDKITKKQLDKLISTLNIKDEIKKTSLLNQILNEPLEESIFTIYNNFFSEKTTKEYIEIFVQKTGINGTIKKGSYNNEKGYREDICIMNPKSVKILENLNKEAEEKYQIEKIEKEKTIKELTEICKQYKTFDDMINDISFHGTQIDINDDIKVGGDNIFWTTDDIKVARNYIRNYSIFIEQSFDRDISKQKDKKIYPFNTIEENILLRMGYTINGERNENGIGFKSVSLLKNGEKVEIPVYEDYLNFLRSKNYFVYNVDEERIKFDKEDNIVDKYQNKKGFIHIIQGINKLKIFDKSTGESDLQDLQYNDFESFSMLHEKGFDGIKIDDFAQSENYGNLQHESIGLTKEALNKIKITKIRSKFYDWKFKEDFKEDFLIMDGVNLKDIFESTKLKEKVSKKIKNKLSK